MGKWLLVHARIKVYSYWQRGPKIYDINDPARARRWLGPDSLVESVLTHEETIGSPCVSVYYEMVISYHHRRSMTFNDACGLSYLVFSSVFLTVNLSIVSALTVAGYGRNIANPRLTYWGLMIHICVCNPGDGFVQNINSHSRNSLENVVCNFSAILFRPHCVNMVPGWYLLVCVRPAQDFFKSVHAKNGILMCGLCLISKCNFSTILITQDT